METGGNMVQDTLANVQQRTTNNTMDAALARLAAYGELTEVSNVNPESLEDQLAFMSMDMIKPNNIWDMTLHTPQLIDAVYVSVRQTEQYNKQTKEIEGKLRTTLVDQEGQSYTTNSPICARVALKLLMNPKCRSKFDPPIPFMFSRTPTLSGGMALSCSIDVDVLRKLVS